MKEQLVKLLMEKANLDEEKANKAVDTIMGFLKENPDKLSGMLGEGGIGEAAGKIGKLFGR